jgi:hypothetical protein
MPTITGKEIKIMNDIIKKIANSLTIDELDDFIKYIWLNDKNNIETLVSGMIIELTAKMK